MTALPNPADLAARRAWAGRAHAKLRADVVDARLTARSRSLGRAARVRRWLLDGVPERIPTGRAR
ncbi:hypothetical protein GCM10022254_21190 [Actinomadura meridiana]|uniref:5-formyltetrahydrofolate cyclo-ligase n=1 Tax=Actinomadura meridiana TaxID=559626 RepID=A0ABP8BX35_9ACTN